MCDPVTGAALAGMAMSAGGTLMQTQEANANQRRMVNARNEAAEAERIRQLRFQDEAGAEFTKATDIYAPENQQAAMADAVLRRTQGAQQAGDEGLDFVVPTAGSAPEVVKSEVARRMLDASRKARETAGRRGAMTGFGDMMFGNNLDVGRIGGRISEVGDFARGSAQLLPLDQQAAANNAYRAPGLFPELLKLGGQGLSMYGMIGAPGLTGAAPVATKAPIAGVPGSGVQIYQLPPLPRI